MPRIAMLLSSFLTGGMERQALSLARSLGDYGFDALMVSLSGTGPLERDIREAGLPSLVLNKKPGLDPTFFYQLAKMYKEKSIDLVHAHNWFAGFYAVGSRLFSRTPVVTTLHGNAYQVAGRRQFLRRLAAKFSSYTVCVGQMVSKEAIRKYNLSPDKVKVIYNGVDCEEFYDSSEREAVRASLGLGRVTTVFVFVGRVSPIKDLPCLLEAAALLARKKDDFRIIIAGSGDALEELKLKAVELGVSDRVLFLGERRDIPELMAASDALVMSSLNEGISMAILEAMASGLPVVATDVGGNSELVQDRSTGLLVKVKSPGSLADAMEKIIDNPDLSTQMGRAGKSLCYKRFSLQQMVEGYCSVYRKVIYE